MHMCRPTRRFLLATGGWLVLGAAAQTEPSLSREIRLSRTTDFTGQVSALLLQELYRRAGFKITVIEMPSARASVEAREGRVDGEVNRIRTYSDSAPQLLRVEPPVYVVSISALFMRASGTRVRTQADLDHYSVAHVRGARFAEDLTKGVSRTVVTDTYSQLLLMLQAGRIEVILMGTVAARLEMRTLGIKDEIGFTELAQLPLYHLLHEKNRELVPFIAAQLRKATESGELERLTARFEKQLFDAVVPAKT